MTRPNQPPPDDDARECPEDLLRDEHLRALGLMLSGFAHEFNTPLAVVASAIDTQRRCQEKLATILQADDLTVDDQAQLRDIVALMIRSMPALDTGLDRAQALARELRLAGRPAAAETPEPVPVVSVLESDLLLLQHETRHGVTVVREYEAEPTVRGRAALLGQVFLNLLRNALQAMEGEGTLTVGVAERDDRAVVTVADTGPGVPEEVLERLFQCEVTTKCAETGTGLGLLVSRQVLDRFGGSIAAANRPEGGAVFTVTLPLLRDA